MRILQVIQKPQRRGAEVFACQLTEELQRQGHALCVTSLYPHAREDRLAPNAPMKLLDGDEDHWAERMPGLNWRLLRKLLAAVEEFVPDIVQVNGARTVKYGAFARRLARGRDWKLVYRVMGNPGYWMTGAQRKLFYRTMVLPCVDGIAAVSDEAKRQIVSLYGDGTPIVTIPQAVDTRSLYANRSRAAVRASACTPEGVPVVLFVGSLSAEKRPDRFLRVVSKAMAVQPDLHAWVVGDGPLRTATEKQARDDARIASGVRFLGVQSNVADYMAAADMLLLTSDTEGVPGVLLEAGWTGLPVVASRVGGVPECVVDGETGLLAEREDEVAFARCVISLLSEGDLRNTMGNAARQLVKERFTLEHVTAQFLDFYSRLLDAAKHRYSE